MKVLTPEEICRRLSITYPPLQGGTIRLRVLDLFNKGTGIAKAQLAQCQTDEEEIRKSAFNEGYNMGCRDADRDNKETLEYQVNKAKLDRPDREKIEEICLPYWDREYPCHCIDCLGRAEKRADQIEALFPGEEEIRKQERERMGICIKQLLKDNGETVGVKGQGFTTVLHPLDTKYIIEKLVAGQSLKSNPSKKEEKVNAQK